MTSNQKKAIKRRMAQQFVQGPSLRKANYSGLQENCQKFGLRSGTQRSADDKLEKRRGVYA